MSGMRVICMLLLGFFLQCQSYTLNIINEEQIFPFESFLLGIVYRIHKEIYNTHPTPFHTAFSKI